MRMTIFADIDNNLMQQTTKCPAGVELADGSVDTSGKVSSSMMPHQKRLVELMQAGGNLIPVTARDYDALTRILVPFNSYRVGCHGALILTPEGTPDMDWQAHIAEEKKEWREHIALLKTSIEALGLHERDNRFLFKRGMDHEGSQCFIGVRGGDETIAELTRLKAELWPHQGGLFRANGDDLAFMAPYASKRRAVKYLKERLMQDDPQMLFIGSGDSTSDVPFMAECHFMLMPTDSQVVNSHIPASTLTSME